MKLTVSDAFGDILDHQRDYASAIDAAASTRDTEALADLALACRTELVAEARRQRDARMLYRLAMASLNEAWTHLLGSSTVRLINEDDACHVRDDLEVLFQRQDAEGLAHEAMDAWYRLFDQAKGTANTAVLARLARTALAEVCSYEALIEAGLTGTREGEL